MGGHHLQGNLSVGSVHMLIGMKYKAFVHWKFFRNSLFMGASHAMETSRALTAIIVALTDVLTQRYTSR